MTDNKGNHMELFLVSGTVRQYPYMGEVRVRSDQRLVWAESAAEAEEKFDKFWVDKSNSYSISYMTESVAANEAIT